jgi:cytochrome c oxidase cbb3-type subunit III
MQRGHLGVLWMAVAIACGGPPAPPAAQKKAEPPPVAPAPPAPPPAPANPAVEHGRELYARMCAVCHGANGEGYKADQAPALAHPEYLASVTDEFLEVAIADGRTGTQMSAWGVGRGGPLTTPDVAALIAFLRSWQRQPSIELDESPVRGNAAQGAEIFARECAKCHGPTAPNLRLLNPELLAHASPGFLRHAIRKGRAPTPMPAYETSLGPQGVEDVVTFLNSLPKAKPQPASAPAMPPPIPLGKVPMNPRGPAPASFETFPKFTKVDVVAREYKRKAKMLLLDARPPTDYAREHIAGAASVPFYDPTPYLEKLPKDAWLIAYCGCPHAESGALAQKLMADGFTKVTVLDEGLWDWKAKGHPMREGMDP